MGVKVSVIIPCFNYGAYLPRAVTSIINQTWKDWEILIVNDGSTDNTDAIVGTLPVDHYPIRYIGRRENRGPSYTRNEGMNAAEGQFLAFLDADDEWYPEKLERQIRLFQDDSSLGLVAAGVHLIDENKGIERRYLPSRFPDRKTLVRSMLMKNVIPATSSVVIRKRCIDDLGGFDEDLRFAEDWDLWLRIASKYGVNFIHEPLIRFYEHPNNVSRDILKMSEGRKVVIKRHSPRLLREGLVRRIDVFRALSYCYLGNARGFQNLGIKRGKMFSNSLKAILLYPAKCDEKDDKYQLLIKSLLPRSLVNLISRS